ncbi:MAG: pyrimidine reductase family protein [Microbacteriaceae bacterium]|nr:pyrimidine reductase family protein [Microbacteriaceae bacterium]
MATANIDRLWPEATPSLTDEAIVAGLTAEQQVVRVNFVSSVDGAVTHNGRSGGLSDDADKRHFELLRRVCDVVLVGAGTVRDEGYGPMRVSEESARWRVANGLPEHPVFAIVSGALDLDPGSRIFTEAPARPIVFTTARGADRAYEFADVADVVIAGTEQVPGIDIVAALHERDLRSVLCEGGPHLFGSLLEDGVVDELFLTVSPTLEAGDAMRISAEELTEPTRLSLATVLASGSTLLLKYRVA